MADTHPTVHVGRDPDEPHAFFRRPATRPRDAGNSSGDPGPKETARSGNHLPNRLLAHRSVRADRRGIDPEQGDLHVIIVGYDTASENIARSWNRRYPSAQ